MTLRSRTQGETAGFQIRKLREDMGEWFGEFKAGPRFHAGHSGRNAEIGSQDRGGGRRG